MIRFWENIFLLGSVLMKMFTVCEQTCICQTVHVNHGTLFMSTIRMHLIIYVFLIVFRVPN